MTEHLDTHKPAQRIRGIYLLPNLLTIAAIFSGFYAIIAAMKGQYSHAAYAIFIALVLDSLDGRVARLLKAQSEFGIQLDSLSDMINFGITPALVMYSWSLSVLGKIGWLIAFLYTVCTALRLARFNVQTRVLDKRFFCGLPTPGAAGCMASIVLISSYYELPGPQLAIPIAIIALALSFFKVSSIRYYSFKNIDLHHRVPFMATLICAVILALISFDPADILFAIFFAYLLSGPVRTLWTFYRRRGRRLKKNK